jgi:hypothetical protein
MGFLFKENRANRRSILLKKQRWARTLLYARQAVFGKQGKRNCVFSSEISLILAEVLQNGN